MSWIGPHEYFYQPGETNSSCLHDTHSFNRPPRAAEFQRRWLEANATTAAESNEIALQTEERTATVAAHETTADIESMEISPVISSKPTTNQTTFTESANSQRDNQCDDIAIESAPSIRPSAQQQRKATTPAKIIDRTETMHYAPTTSEHTKGANKSLSVKCFNRVLRYRKVLPW